MGISKSRSPRSPVTNLFNFVDRCFPKLFYFIMPWALRGSTHLALVIIISHCYYFLRHSWQVTTFFNLALKESWLVLKIKMTLTGFIISHVKSSQQHILGSGDDYWVRHIKKCFWQWLPYQSKGMTSHMPIMEATGLVCKTKSTSVVMTTISHCAEGKLDRNMFSAFCIPSPSPPRSKQLQNFMKGAWKMLEKLFF